MIYYLRLRPGHVWMLTMYAKNEADTIPASVLKKIKEELDGKDKTEHRPGDSRWYSPDRAWRTGRITNVPSVSSVRQKTGLSQLKFATLLRVSVRTLQEWEQGRREPLGAARTLPLIAAKNPRALLDVA